MRQFSRSLAVVLVAAAACSLSPRSFGQNVTLDPSGRYYRNSSGQPVFLIGYYAWAAAVDGYTIDHVSSYSGMMNQGSPYRINYIRIGAQSPRMSASSNPPSWNGLTVPCPYATDGSNRADLNNFNAVFWNGLAAQCVLGQQKGFIVHISIFDGVGTRSGPAWGYGGSWWNPANQVATFYANPDTNGNGGIDQVGEAYRTSEFNNGNPAGGTISYYEKRYIDKVIATTNSYDNVMYEVGNELGADSAWNSAVIAYIKTQTSKVVTQGGNSTTAGTIGAGAQGWSPHDPATVSQYKSMVASVVGSGYPAWEDTDNNDWSCTFGYCNCGGNCGGAYAAQDTAVRQAAWYSFAGGAAVLGGFNVDWWDWWNPNARGFSTTLGNYMKNLQDFISNTGVPFANMVPHNELVSNGNSTNSCLAAVGSDYVIYVLNDASITVDLTTMSGSASWRTYDPVSGVFSSFQNVNGGSVQGFNKPGGASDWVLQITNGSGEVLAWNTLGTTLDLGAGIVPAVATDAQGNIHAIFVSGNSVQYRKYTPGFSLVTSESISAPAGAYYPHIVCDSNSVPHITYTNGTIDYASNIYYTNRIGGSWKSPVAVFTVSGNSSVWYPRISLYSTFAYIGYQIGLPNEQGLAGMIVKVTNLSSTPSVAAQVTTACRTQTVVNQTGTVYAFGRNGGAGTYIQEYDSNLNTVGGFVPLMSGYPGGSQGGWTDSSNVTHFAAWAVQANGSFPCNDRCGMNYNNSSRKSGGSYLSPINGLLGGAAGTGPDGGVEVSGFWNDDVAPVITKDALGTVYVAYREWTTGGVGRITKVDTSGFTQSCSTDPNCGGSTCTGTQFSGGITRRRWWNCEIAPALSRGVYVAWDDASGHAFLRPVGVSVTSSSSSLVSIDMGNPDATNGINNISCCDGNVVPNTIGGRTCKNNATVPDTYMYFDVSDGFAFQGSKPNLYINLDYFDRGTGSLALQYDGAGNAYTSGPTVALTGTETWKTVTWNVTDAYFGNRENGNSDFRIFHSGTSPDFYLDKMSIYLKALTGTPVSIPGTIQAEAFDNGGEGQAYHDTSAANEGGSYRLSEGVDVEPTTDAGAGFDVGYITTGEYINYQVNVAATGFYDFVVRVASPNTGTKFHIEMNGNNVTGSQTIPNTGGFQTWTNVNISHISLTFGVQTMKFVVEVGGFNYNYTTINPNQSPHGGSNWVIPGTIEAENFDDGGENVAYHDVEAANQGGQYRTGDGVDIEACSDTGGGFDVGYINSGEWLEYTTNVSTTGDYAVKMRVASNGGGGSFHMSMNGATIFTARAFPDTGGWQNWTTITVPGIAMTAGNSQVLRMTVDVGSWNFNNMTFAFGGADVVSVDMGSPNIDDGMNQVVCCDGNTVLSSLGGHYSQNNATIPDHYMYFAVADGYIFQGNKNNVTITFDYYDKDTGTLSLNYDGATNAYTGGPSVALTNSLTWKTAVWQVGDAYFGNRENGFADFRIFYSGVDFYIDTVMVFATVGTPPPGQATNPSPANAATLVPITSSLTWTAGSGATSHDVRFGTANPPPFIQNQAGTSYTPATMAANTTYFWRIDEKNTGGTTTGNVWSFTTLPVPGAASAPNPANAATLVPITSSVSWTAGSNAASHDVRFGTANPPPFIQNQAGTSYTPATMAANTVYFWRIDEKNTSGTTTGTVWSFTTLPLPGAASAPNPANAATLVPITSSVSWTAGSNAASHDVRFGTANPPPFIQNQAGTSYTPATMAANTVYFWRIDEKNTSGTTTGTVWSFTTLPLPGLASAPSPANAATLVPITSSVSWTAGSNAASHDVRFGTANPPPFIQNQAGTSYTPATMAANTVYFWRIDEKNTSGTTTGTVWSFTTLPLPGLASAPNPANAATGVSISASLSWTAGSNAASHDVRFGTANPPPFIQNQAGTSYTPATMAANTVYFWRIDEKNTSGTTIGTVWSFTTLALPGLATVPSPANAATGVSVTPTLSWTAGSNATSHDVRFGTANPPSFIQNQAGTTYAPSTLANNTVYFWRIDEKNGSGTTTGTVWSFTTVASGPATINVKVAGNMAIDGSSSDWNIGQFVTKVRGGEHVTGDFGIVGFDGGVLYYGGYFTGGVLPTNAADHTAKIYCLHDSVYLYILARMDDNQIQTQNPVGSNWANDCIEIYLDPGNAGGSTAINNSTSDIQLVIDALNQKNVYMTTAGYATQVLAGVTSAVTTDGTGWWLEARIQKSVLSPVIPNSGTIGIEFNFRDNDNNNDNLLTTGYDWADPTSGIGFPSKIPNNWGKTVLAALPATPGLATAPSPANAATGVSVTPTLSWTAGANALSHDVRFGTANPPPFVVNQTATTYAPSTLANSTTYFWRIDEKNAGGTTTGTVWSFTTLASGPVTLNNSAFPSNADGWNIVLWHSGSFSDGTMAWTSTNGNPSGNMLSNGSGATDSSDSCTREGGEINKAISTAGYNTLVQVVYDLRFDTNQTGGTCIGSCMSTVLEGDCSDKIAVYYSTAGTGGPWTLLETVNASAVTQGVWSTRTINCPAAANNKANFAVRMRFQVNTTSDGGRLDNVKVIATP